MTLFAKNRKSPANCSKNIGHVRAFTVIELIIVITIVGLLAFTANTNLLDFNSLRLSHAIYKIQSDIRYAQQLAVALQLRTRVTFDTATDIYTVDVENGTWGPAKDPLTKEDFAVQLNAGDFQGVDITSASIGGSNILIYDKWGIPYNNAGAALAAPGTVQLNASRTIEITDRTGKVKIV